MHRIQKKFTCLTENDLTQLSKCSKMVTYDKDSIIIEYGKYSPYFYYILDGVVRGYNYKENGEDHNWFFIHTEQYFLSPDKLLNKEKTSNHYIFEAVTDITAYRIKHNELIHLAAQNPRIFEFYHDALKVIIASLFERIRILTIESAEDRYKHLIETRPLIPLHVQKKHIAQFLGITPNSFSRLLKRMERN